MNYCFNITQSVTNDVTFSFTCNDEDFLKEFSKTLETFFKKYDGKISIK